MKFVRVTSTAALFLLFGTIVPAYAQQNQQKDKQGKPETQQGKRQEAAPPPAQKQRAQGQTQQQPQQQRAQQTQQPQQKQSVQQTQQQRPQQQPQQQAQRPQQARQQQHPQRTQQQAVTWQQQRGWLTQGAWQGHTTWQQGRAQRWDTDHRTWLQRGGYGGYYIPQATFGLYFGSQHWFRMNTRPTMYMGYPRFLYGGYSFLLLDPWPEYWADSWYSTDDVYVDYDDGYYLYNRRYPNVRLAITVLM